VSNQVQQTSAHEALIAAGATPVGNLTADDWMIAKRQPYYLATLRADRRDARRMALFGKAREMGWRSKQHPCHVERAFVGTESSSDGSAKR
jgi:hypothetical protein